jgi:hypothetical protein
VVVLAAAGGSAAARPYTPADDAVVLERLPERSDPTLAELKRLRASLAANPRDLAVAVDVARRSIQAARTTGDPRFTGQAESALGPWWRASDVPPEVLLLRATIRQNRHEFAAALADLDAILATQADSGQARLTRATVLTVQGRYAEAMRDCAALARVASQLVATTCSAAAASVNGQGASAYRTLTLALARPGASPTVRAWAATLAAEIAARAGRPAEADAHFRDALAHDPRDAYAKAAYADFLLDERRAREVVALVAGDTSNDALLLRLALAERALPDAQAAYAAHRSELAARFAAAQRRGDSLHLREQARFRLEIEGDARGALALAQRNWALQREPADLRLLAAAARAAGDAAALKTVSDWLDATRLEDAAIVALVRGGTR